MIRSVGIEIENTWLEVDQVETECLVFLSFFCGSLTDTSQIVAS